MSVIYVLLIASAFIGLGFLGLFIKSVKQGQFDDTWSPARRMLIDDDPVAPAAANPTTPTAPATTHVKKT
jgi:cbb3-type cytochrome oxidase maturation protein